MSDEGEIIQPKVRRSQGVRRVLETVAVWLIVIGLIAGVGYGVSLAVRDGLARLDEMVIEARNAPPPFSADQVVAPGLGEPSIRREPVAAPEWAVLPEPLYPATAGTKVDGSASLSCLIDEAGLLTRCRIVEETPEGLGFGAAALETAERARMKPIKIDGRPVPTVFAFTLFFHPPADASSSAPRRDTGIDSRSRGH